jgi:drug/metabolite transporter (DMT)-like permease
LRLDEPLDPAIDVTQAMTTETPTDRPSPETPPEPLPGRMRTGMSMREALTANGAIIFNAVTWGTFFPIMEFLLSRWDIVSATAGRQVIGAVALCIVLWLVEKKTPFRRGIPWGTMAWLGFVGITLGSMLTTLSVYFSSGLSAAIIAATNPISAAITAWALHRVPLTQRIVIGAIFSVTGGVIAAMAIRQDEFGFGVGELILVVANVTWTWYSLAMQHHLRAFSQLERNAYTLLPSAITLVLLAVVLHIAGVNEIRIDLSLEPLLCLIYMGFVPIALANFLWHWGVARIGVNIASMYMNLIPVSAVLVTLYMGGIPSWGQLAGGTIIVAGVLYAQAGAFRRPKGR